ncbi:uncharacterized protein VP01_463g9 [Puccinia sorghi]|uniref:HAT C-terminal dimerisation domain-containing protein n=1 Tax=Puccinia sorghi TaxID=27349 RepID=A0A0L6UNC2_9BASI|nr:uncharacterized protein VP01_463g9 [Puccinia sorghi]
MKQLSSSNICQVQSTYNAHQLLPSAKQMLSMLKKYLVLALQTTAPLCAMIHNPHINMLYIEKNTEFIQKEISSYFSPPAILSDFKVDAQHYDRSPTCCGSNQLEKKKPQSSILVDIFGGEQMVNNLTFEIQDYLRTSNEGPKTDVLNYWFSIISIYPLLAAMARCFLAIPATSSPSESVFSQCKTVVGPHHGRISAESIENLLCLKEWYYSMGTLDPMPYNENDQLYYINESLYLNSP